MTKSNKWEEAKEMERKREELIKNKLQEADEEFINAYISKDGKTISTHKLK